ncbi:Hypothetical predicted protein [Paramuricea clavata]|uniref:Uncharacterized protein n=1 Tax=Paramuricea clavata TaxID=317549 RepID=A0A7D9M1A8_PARCT|nr:Hypothetical predicted protein [Paramuricea clavata]
MENIHSTRLKEKILSRIPELHESKKGRDVVLTFKDELILFNVVKHKRRKANELDKLRHSPALETPFPLFTGLLIHANTRKKGLLNTFAHKGLSVSYKKVQDVQLNITKQLCKKYNGFVCPPSLKEEVFTTAAVDSIDHDPSSTTATKSFHGTSISIFQHLEKALEPNQIDLSVDFEDSSTKIELPESYTNLSPTKSKAAEYPLQTVNRENSSDVQPMDEMDDWLEHLMQMNGKDDDIKNRFSWSGFHSKKSAIRAIKTTSTLLPLLNESVNSTAMLRHTMGVVKQILLKINPQQPIVLTADQPVYAFGKQVQWMYPEFYGESNVVTMMGALHIGMAFLNTIGD